MPPRITVVGSINRDLSVQVVTLPRRGETVLGGEFQSVAGGKGANQAVAAARYGASVALVGRLGRDAFGDELFAALCSEGIDMRHVSRDPEAASGVALILVDAHGENCITVAPGANACLSVDDVEAARDAIASADILLLQLEIPLDAVRRAAEIAHQNGVPVVLNPAPAQELDDDLLRLISVFTPNATEAEFYADSPVTGEACASAAAILDRIDGTVVITLGAAGSVYADRSGAAGHVEGCEVRAVDSTAAGDVFNGVLSVRLAEGAPLTDALSDANAAAALSVTRFGAQNAAPTREQVDTFSTPSNGHSVAIG